MLKDTIPNMDIADYHKEWLNLVQNNQKVVIQAPRGHGKTEVIIIGYMIYRAFTQKDFEGLIISKSLPQSTGVLRRIRNHLRGNPPLATSIPGDRESTWSKTEIELTNGSRIMCKPYSDNVRGEHVDVVCCDEVGTYEDKEIYQYAITPTVNKKKGKIICIGTPKSHIDLLNDLTKNKAYVAKIYRAVDSKGKPLWPKGGFTVKFLREIKEAQGNLVFSREYLCNPLSEENKLFPYTLLSKGFLPQAKFLTERRPGNFTYYIGADFAMSGAVGADYSVFVVLEKDEDGIIKIVKVERYKGTPYESQKQFFINLMHSFKPIGVLIDESSFGQTFFQQLRDKGMWVKGFKFTYDTKHDLIMHIVNQFEKGNIKIPMGCELMDQKIIEVMINELLSFGIEYSKTGKPTFQGIGAHDDCVIGLALAVYSATSLKALPLPRVKRTSYTKT